MQVCEDQNDGYLIDEAQALNAEFGFARFKLQELQCIENHISIYTLR